MSIKNNEYTPTALFIVLGLTNDKLHAICLPSSPLNISVLLQLEQSIKFIWYFMCIDIFFVWLRSCAAKSKTLG